MRKALLRLGTGGGSRRLTCPPPLRSLAVAVKLLDEEGRRLQRSRLKLRMQAVALYAGLPAAHQLGVFEPAPRGVRKVRVPGCARHGCRRAPGSCVLQA